jgi:hypothetical protein
MWFLSDPAPIEFKWPRSLAADTIKQMRRKKHKKSGEQGRCTGMVEVWTTLWRVGIIALHREWVDSR